MPSAVVIILLNNDCFTFNYGSIQTKHWLLRRSLYFSKNTKPPIVSAKKKTDPAKVKSEPVKVNNIAAEAVFPPAKDFFDGLGNKAQWMALGLITLIGFIVFKDYLLLQKAYFFKDIGSDSYNYSYPFLHQQAEYIAKHGIPKWSFNFGMGQSLFPFFLRDPFDIFLYIAGKDNIAYGMVYTELLKIVLGGFIFFYYLKELKLSDYTAITGSALFAFCGFTILGSSWYIFSFESFNMALMLLGFELLFLKKNWYLFPFAIFLVCISQPFNLYVYGIFLTAYTLLRHFQTNTFTFKNITTNLLTMAGLGILGMLLAAPFMIENILQLLESPRGSGTNSYADLLKTTPMSLMADPLQMGTSVMRFFSNDILGNGTEFKGWTNYMESPTFYCGLPCLLLMPQVFQFLEKKIKITFLVFIAIWIIPILFPYFRRAFWLFTGDYYRAYSFFVAFFFLYYSAFALDQITKRRKINLVILVVSTIVLFALMNYPFFEDREIINPMITVFVSLMVIVYATLLFFIGKPNSSPYLKYGFLAGVAIELIFLSGITVNDRKAITSAELSAKGEYNDYTIDALNYLRQIDHSFFRIDKTYASSPAMHFSINDGLAQSYHGTSGYSPFNQQYYIYYLQLMGISNRNVEIESRWAMGVSARPILESENRVKYILAKKNVNPLWNLVCEELPAKGDVRIFRNKFVLPVGFTYDHYLKESIFEPLTITQKDFTTLRTCIIRDADVSKVQGLKEFQLKDTIPPAAFSVPVYKQCVDELSRDTLVVTKFEETSLAGKITATDDKMMYLSIPYDGGWTLKVDGQKTDKIILDGGMTGVMLKKGPHTIEMNYDLRYFKPGLILCLLGLLAYGGLWFYTRKKSKEVPAN